MSEEKSFRKGSVIREILDAGWSVRCSQAGHQLMIRPELRERIGRFSGATFSGGLQEHSGMKMFGQRNYTVFYDMQHPEKIVEHLTKLFLSNYPNPSQGQRAAFARVLHQYSLHSELCSGKHCYIYHQNPAERPRKES